MLGPHRARGRGARKVLVAGNSRYPNEEDSFDTIIG
jgi:hypothetical protein